MLNRRWTAALLFAAWLAAPMAASAGETAPLLPPAAVDHHMHIQGPQMSALLGRMAKQKPELFEGMDPAMLKDRTGADAVAVLDEAGIRTGIILSEAYMFASFLFDTPKADVARLTRVENQYNVDAALASKGRLKAFVGIAPTADNADSELRYWAGRPGVSGVKLHLANGGFDPRSATDVAKLEHFFDTARTLHMPVIVHVRGRPDYTVADAKIFVDQILPHIGDDPIQIAHAGGWGGLDDATLATLGVYADAIARNAPGTRNLVFDIALVVLNDKSDPQKTEAFVTLMRRIGLKRFVVGSDWPGVYTPAKHNALMETQLPLTRAEWLVVLANPASYLR